MLVTRPKGRSSRTADELRRRGAEVLELPSIRTVALDEQTELWQAFDRMDTYQWIVFTSPTGAEIFFCLLYTSFNINTLQWDEEILEELDIPRCMLPTPKPSSCVYGMADPSFLGGPIPIAGAAGDQQSALDVYKRQLMYCCQSRAAKAYLR